jgi:hypothetical protein
MKDETGSEKQVLTVVTPTTSQLPPFEYFGCDSLVKY